LSRTGGTGALFNKALQHVSGFVVLRVRIGKDGNVSKVEKISGSDAMLPAVSEAVKQWKYRPYLLDGSAVEAETTVITGQL
jgi:protein TonB